ncbi:response regulator [Pikeienuella piscinae]|uniref:Response regulator n=1 Tax=Pikeienuella piscinae TaxID=2748098 RepID=A0A7L5BYW3_9RHOB|nr:response regulator [Pikeienuella piscinae]QIE55697.1 response regulator [Pikeienuella piscinae]
MNSTTPATDQTNLSAVIAPYLPYLRRFARALTGSQEAGDGFVAQTLETLIADRNAMDHALEPRTGLYRLFHAIWSSAAIPDGAAGGGRATSPARQFLLLTAVEEFTPEEAAKVMDIDADEAGVLARAGRDEVEKSRRARVLIIEDEPIIALDIESIVAGMDHTVVAVAQTHKEAAASASETKPDLILADIQLADGSSGVEAVDEILTKMTVPVIFITAYPERLLTGDRVEPPFLITKPFRPEAVEAAIAQALFHDQA